MGKTGEVVRNDKTSLLLKHELESTKLVWWAPGAVQVERLVTQMDGDDATKFEDQYVIEEEDVVRDHRLTIDLISDDDDPEAAPECFDSGDEEEEEAILEDVDAEAGGAEGELGGAAAESFSSAAVFSEDGTGAGARRVLPETVKMTSFDFRRFELPRSPSEDDIQDYQEMLRDYFTGKIHDQSLNDWTLELASLKRQIRSGPAPPPSLSIWQAAGYKHAQRILKDTALKGCLFWWSCGSGKSIMVALLIELLAHEFRHQPNMTIVVVTTAQNVRENGLKENFKSLLKFSPRHAVARPAGADLSEDISVLRKKFRQQNSAKIRQQDYLSFVQFHSQYSTKIDRMKNVCLIIDECHELFNEKLKNRREIYNLVSEAHKVFTLSGTPWRNYEQMLAQLSLLRTSSSNADLNAKCAGLGCEERLRAFSAGCVSYVDGSKDLSTHPIDGGWSVERCKMVEAQLFNFSTRCHLQLSHNTRGVQNPCQLAKLLLHGDKNTRDMAYAACRHVQVAAGVHWGSESSGLKRVLHEDPRLEAVKKLAPKFERLIEALQKGRQESLAKCLDTKHLVYSAYQSTISHLGITLDNVQGSGGRHIFKRLLASDFEWKCSGNLELKPDIKIEPDVIYFVILKGNAEEKQKLKAAFGFVTPGGERFAGLLRARSHLPLVQVLLGARETNQGLTFLRLQYIHVMEPNPRGWGQIMQTIGRGIRRGTHEGIVDKEMRTVRTKIYTTALDEKWLKAENDRQLDQTSERLAQEHKRFHLEYRKLIADGLIEEKRVKMNLKSLSKNIQKLSLELDKLKEGWLRVKTGKIIAGHVKTALVRTWQLLPDDAIFHVTKKEEEGRSDYDRVIKESSVDYELLRLFHGTRNDSSSSNRKSYRQDVKTRFDPALRQEFAANNPVRVGMMFDITFEKKICLVCGDSSQSAKGTKQKYGVQCSQGHFVCSACYQALASENRCLSAKKAQEHFHDHRSGGGTNVKCDHFNCYAHFCLDSVVKFPFYWRPKENAIFIENPFMKPRMQSLIRSSIRPQCGPSGCVGADGSGRGINSAQVTRVLRIQNRQIWEKYWRKKQEMIANRHGVTKLGAQTMHNFSSIFPSVQTNTKVNELFLFHGTTEESAFSIAQNGFDPSKASLRGMYGAGTYCADYSCKSMQYTRPNRSSQRIFVVGRVLMGKAYATKKTMQGHKEPPEGYDSVYAKDGCQTHHNEFITYDPGQVYPEYIVFIKLH